MWKIELHRLVLNEDFKGLDHAAVRLILKSIYKKLSKDPEGFGSPLSGEYKGYWKLRVGYYRVIYRIIKDEVLVLVIKVGIRRDDKVYAELFYRLRKV
jgi:mRNA interferase RelE/StbE